MEKFQKIRLTILITIILFSLSIFYLENIDNNLKFNFLSLLGLIFLIPILANVIYENSKTNFGWSIISMISITITLVITQNLWGQLNCILILLMLIIFRSIKKRDHRILDRFIGMILGLGISYSIFNILKNDSFNVINIKLYLNISLYLILTVFASLLIYSGIKQKLALHK